MNTSHDVVLLKYSHNFTFTVGITVSVRDVTNSDLAPQTAYSERSFL